MLYNFKFYSLVPAPLRASFSRWAKYAGRLTAHCTSLKWKVDEKMIEKWNYFMIYIWQVGLFQN